MRKVLLLLLFLTAAGRASPSTQLREALDYYDIGHYRKAEQAYLGLLKTDLAFQAQKELVILYSTWGKNVQSASALEKLKTDFSGDARLPKAIQYIENLHCFLKTENIKPSTGNRIWDKQQQLRVKIASGKTADIQGFIGKFAQSKHIAQAAYEIAADLHYKHYKYEQAEALYQYVANNHPESDYALWSQESMVLSKICRSKDAAAALGALITKFSAHPLLPESLYGIARRYDEARDYQKAKLIYQQIIQQYPDSLYADRAEVDIRKGQIQSLIDAGEDDKVLGAANKLVADFPDNPYLPWAISQGIGEERYYAKAFQLIETSAGKEYFQKAIAIWQIALTHFPDSDAAPEACCWMADSYYALGQYEKAIGFYQKMVNDWPNYCVSWSALFRLGCCYEKLGETNKAKVVYEQLLEKYPACKAAKPARDWLERNK